MLSLVLSDFEGRKKYRISQTSGFLELRKLLIYCLFCWHVICKSRSR